MRSGSARQQGATADGYTPTALSEERTRADEILPAPDGHGPSPSGRVSRPRAAPDRRRTGFPRCPRTQRESRPCKATHRPLDRSSTLPCRRLSARRVTVRRIVAANCQGDVDVTSIETGPSWVERLNPRHWTLVWKLVIVGLVPALLALALGVLRIADQAGSAADLGRSGRLLEARNEIVAAADALRARARPGHPLRREQRQRRPRRARQQPRARRPRRSTRCGAGSPPPPPTSSPPPWPRCSARQDALDLVSSLRADGHGHAVGAVRPGRQPLHQRHRHDRRAGPRDPAPAAHPGHGGPGRRVERRHQRVGAARRSSTRSSRAPSARASRCPATPRWSTRPPRSSSTTTATTRPRSPPSSWPSSATSPTPRPPAGWISCRSAHPHRAVPAGPAGQRLGHGLRPGPGEHRPHGGADQRRAVRHGRRGRAARQQPRGHQLGHPHARPARRHHDRGAGGAVADPVAAAAAQLRARRRRAAAPAGRREHARR